MLAIKKITIENFRGIRSPLILDFFKNNRPTSVILYGGNGTGKSSIVDAWEWFLTSEIKSLQKESVSTTDYPHRLSDGEGCSIKVDFDHETMQTAGAVFNKRRITAPTTSGDYAEFKTHTVYPSYLRYADLQEFVYLSKTEKYKYIARYFGLESLMKIQTEIQASLARLRIQSSQQENVLKQNTIKIIALIDSVMISDTNVLEFVNTIARRHSIAPVTHFRQASIVKEALNNLVQLNPVATELAGWMSFQTRLNAFYPLPNIDENITGMEEAFVSLKADETNITKLILTNLYANSLTILSSLEDKTICPLCDKIFNGDLIEHIQAKHIALSELQVLKGNYDAKKVVVSRLISQIQQKISAIQIENNPSILKEFGEFFRQGSSVADQLPEVLELINKPLTELQILNISSDSSVATIRDLKDNEIEYKDAVGAKIIALNNDIASRNLAEDVSKLAQLLPTYKELLKYEAKVAYLSTIIQNLEATYIKLTNFIQGQIQGIFAAIQSDLADCYNVLEDSNMFLRNPEIKLVTDRDKAVELEIEFAGTRTTPAFKVMSESQVNSFGLAVFLSAVKHFNSGFKFIILDDVVNSFDAFKRPKVATLIANKFSDFQFLILTHDQVFFLTMQNKFPNWQRFKFTAWDYTTGPAFRLSRSYTEDIQHHIDEDEPIKAGQSLGRYLEWLLGTINEKIETPLRYKLENAYTLVEFYEPFVSRLNGKIKKPGHTHNLTNQFAQMDQGTIFRNYCAHWKNESTPFTSREIDIIFRKWADIERMLFCETCKDFVEYKKNGSTEYIKCGCGNLDLKNESFYNVI